MEMNNMDTIRRLLLDHHLNEKRAVDEALSLTIIKAGSNIFSTVHRDLPTQRPGVEDDY